MLGQVCIVRASTSKEAALLTSGRAGPAFVRRWWAAPAAADVVACRRCRCWAWTAAAVDGFAPAGAPLKAPRAADGFEPAEAPAKAPRATTRQPSHALYGGQVACWARLHGMHIIVNLRIHESNATVQKTERGLDRSIAGVLGRRAGHYIYTAKV